MITKNQKDLNLLNFFRNVNIFGFLFIYVFKIRFANIKAKDCRLIKSKFTDSALKKSRKLTFINSFSSDFLFITIN